MLRQFRYERNDFEVRQKIGDRKQKQNFHAAISEMTLGQSSPKSDFDLSLIIHGDMRPGLKEKLVGKGFASSDECIHIENAWRQISYVPER